MGRKIYEKFQTVVVLKRQMRSADPRWNLLLKNARVGKCTEEDLQILNSLKLDPRQSQYGEGLWDDAVLVTPRHSVRNAWNAAALERHCHKEKVQKITVPAQDIVHGRGLNLSERVQVAKRDGKRSRTTTEHSTDLPRTVDIALGMKVMILLTSRLARRKLA